MRFVALKIDVAMKYKWHLFLKHLKLYTVMVIYSKVFLQRFCSPLAITVHGKQLGTLFRERGNEAMGIVKLAIESMHIYLQVWTNHVTQSPSGGSERKVGPPTTYSTGPACLDVQSYAQLQQTCCSCPGAFLSNYLL